MSTAEDFAAAETLAAAILARRAPTYELRQGSLAYVDTLTAGLVPCKIAGYEQASPFCETVVRVVVTATRGGYKRGEVLKGRLGRVVAREAVIERRDCSPRIRNGTTHHPEG